MQQTTHQQVTVSSLLGLMALAIVAGRSKETKDGDASRDARDLPVPRETACSPQAEAAN